jgi:hypothetical protein
MDRKIYFLSDYNWVQGTLVKENKKSFKIAYNGQKINVPKEKCALPNEKVCVVWETWKGRNGRGGYRVEREKYPQYRIPANMISYQHDLNKNGRVEE